MSKLRNFITENRREFDDEMPPSKLWDNISRSTQPNNPIIKRSFIARYKWMAAAASIIITLGVLYFVNITKSSRETVSTEPTVPSLQAMSPEHAMEARKIFMRITEQQQQLKTLSADMPALYERFTRDLQSLDSAYKVLEQQSKKAANREVILDAMMQNLRLQAGLLARQLLILNQYNNNQNNKNEEDNLRTI